MLKKMSILLTVLFMFNFCFSSFALTTSDPLYETKQSILSTVATDYSVGSTYTEYKNLPLNIFVTITSPIIVYKNRTITKYLENPTFGTEFLEFSYNVPSVDFNSIDFCVDFVLKNGYKQASFILENQNSTKNQPLPIYNFSQKVSLSNIQLEDIYSFKLTVDNIEYIGSLYFTVDDHNKIVYDISFIENSSFFSNIEDFQANRTFENIITASKTVAESSNNKQIERLSIQEEGKLDNYTYLYTPPESGYLEIATSSVGDYDLYLYDTNNQLLVSRTSTGNDYLKAYVNKGEQYSISVRKATNSVSPVSLMVQRSSAYKWYSQNKGGDASFAGYWNTTNLNNVYFPNMSSNQSSWPLMLTNPSSYDNYIMSDGCFIACWAMLLYNHPSLGRLSSAYDLRQSNSYCYNNLLADPYSVILANTSLKSIIPSSIYDTSTGRYNFTSWTGSQSPVYCYRTTIVNAFGFNYYSDVTEMSLSSYTTADKVTLIATALSNSKSGVIVSLNNGSHYIVITGDRGNSYSNPNDRFIICDPGPTNAIYGDNVAWSSNIYSSFDFDDITKMYYFHT